MSNRGTSPLLHCLAECDHVWADILLLQLWKQGSAGAVALTCSQLRTLCHKHVQALNLSKLAGPTTATDVLAAHAAALPEHFPSCKTVRLLAGSDDSYCQLPVVLPLVGRLPKLNCIAVQVVGPEAPLPTAMLLGSLRTAVTGLQRLNLDLHHSWSSGRCCWSQLVEMTQLTGLQLSWLDQAPEASDHPYKCTDLSALGSLSNLQQLVLHPASASDEAAADAEQQQQQQQQGVYSWLGDLTALTALDMSIATASGLPSIRTCTNLRSLQLGLDQLPDGLGPDVWSGIGELSQLTSLHLLNGPPFTGLAECAAAIEKLTCLSFAWANTWGVDLLGAFSQLPKLKTIKGGWRAAEGEQQQRGGSICASVTSLEAADGLVPFQAFPNLQKVWQMTPIQVEAFRSLPRHCPKLEDMRVMGLSRGSIHDFTLDAAAPLSERISAISGLAKLQHLSGLGWKPAVGAEVAALVTAAEGLAKLKLEKLGLVLEPASDVSLVCLMPLARLTGLDRVSLMVNNKLVVAPEEADALLSALCRVRHVSICADAAVIASMRAARDRLQGIGLRLPQQLVLREL